MKSPSNVGRKRRRRSVSNRGFASSPAGHQSRSGVRRTDALAVQREPTRVVLENNGSALVIGSAGGAGPPQVPNQGGRGYGPPRNEKLRQCTDDPARGAHEEYRRPSLTRCVVHKLARAGIDLSYFCRCCNRSNCQRSSPSCSRRPRDRQSSTTGDSLRPMPLAAPRSPPPPVHA